MEHRKVVKILQCLSPHLQDDFGLFMDSPLHNKSEVLSRFNRVLQRRISAGCIGKTTAEDLHEELHPRSKMSENYINKLFSGLLAKLNEFIAWNSFRMDVGAGGTYLLKGYNAMQLDALVPSAYKYAVKIMDLEPELSDDWFHWRYGLEREYGVYEFRQPRTPQDKQLGVIDRWSRTAFLSRSLELAIAVLNHNLVFPNRIPEPDFSGIEHQIGGNPGQWPELVEARYQAFRLLYTNQLGSVSRLLAILGEKDSRISQEIKTQLRVVALNCSLVRANRGDETAMAEADLLYLSLYESGALSADGHIAAEHFKNIISLRTKVGEVAWARAFFEQNAASIASQRPELALKYNEGVIMYYEKSLTEAIRAFNEVIGELKDDIHYGLDAQSFLLMALYERNEPDDSYLIEARCNAFRVALIRNDKINPETKAGYADFVRLFLKLHKARDKRGRKREAAIRELKGAILESKAPNRWWFSAAITMF